MQSMPDTTQGLLAALLTALLLLLLLPCAVTGYPGPWPRRGAHSAGRLPNMQDGRSENKLVAVASRFTEVSRHCQDIFGGQWRGQRAPLRRRRN